MEGLGGLCLSGHDLWRFEKQCKVGMEGVVKKTRKKTKKKMSAKGDFLYET